MPNNYYVLVGDAALGCLALLSLALVGHLIRLKISEIRKNRIMAIKAERFGLIQEITATGTTVTQSSTKTGGQESIVTIVPAPDKRAKRWTKPAPSPTAGFQWN